MDDRDIIELYVRRDEQAIHETQSKYGNYLNSIARRILYSREDAMECVNDTFWKIWSLIPPEIPVKFHLFAGKITRNIAINRYKSKKVVKRGGENLTLVLEEVEYMTGISGEMERKLEEIVFAEVLNQFLKSLSVEKRKIFVQRYWYLCSVKEISKNNGISQSKVKMSLHRMRSNLRVLLEKEEIWI